MLLDWALWIEDLRYASISSWKHLPSHIFFMRCKSPLDSGWSLKALYSEVILRGFLGRFLELMYSGVN